MRRQNLNNLHQMGYYKPEKARFDEYVFCRECRDYVFEYCSIHGPLLVLPDDKVPSGTNFPSHVPRAALTIPGVFLHLAPSSIPGAGIGVFSSLTLPSGIRFGPYRGKITKAIESAYCWQTYDEDNRPLHVVDAADAEKSNWMRYVNCSRHWSEQNLLAYQYKGQIYYRTIKTIPQFTELLVFYGSEFANILKVDSRLYKTPPQVYYGNDIYVYEITSNILLDANISINAVKHLDIFDISENICKAPTEIKSYNNPNTSTSTQTPLADNMSKNNVTKEEIVIKSEREPNEKVETFAINKVKSQKEINNKDIQKEQSNQTSIIEMVTEFERERSKEVPTKDALKHILKFTKITNTLTNNQLPSNTPKTLLSKIYSCDICTYKTCQQRHLTSHLKMHKLPKVFSCDVCAYKCSCGSKMERHIKTHTNDHLYRDIFEQIKDKRLFKEDNRTYVIKKAFSCDFCQYTTIRKSSLIEHVRTHTGDKPFTCNLCEYRSVKKFGLKRHLETHYRNNN